MSQTLTGMDGDFQPYGHMEGMMMEMKIGPGNERNEGCFLFCGTRCLCYMLMMMLMVIPCCRERDRRYGKVK